MSNKIKPPKGYRMLKRGEKIEAADMCFYDGEWKMDASFGVPMYGRIWYPRRFIPFARRGGVIRRVKPQNPTAEQCWKWLAKSSCALIRLADYWCCNGCYETTPLAAVRAAIKQERKGNL